MNQARKKPAEVLRAVKFLYISVAIEYISVFYNKLRFRFIPDESMALWVTWLALIVVWYLLLAFLVTRISIGKNWARIAYLVLAVAQIPFSLGSIFSKLLINYMFIDAMLIAASVTANIVGLYFIFSTPGKHWFSSSAND